MSMEAIEMAFEQIVETVDLKVVLEFVKEFAFRFWATIESAVEAADFEWLREVLQDAIEE